MYILLFTYLFAYGYSFFTYKQIYMFTHIYIYTYTHIHTYTHTYMHACIHAYIYIYINVGKIHIFIFISVYSFIICIYICIFCVLSNLRLDSLAFLFESQQGLQGQMNSKDKKIKKRKPPKKEDPGARKGRKVAKHCVFPMICGSGGSKRGSLKRRVRSHVVR